MAQWHEIVGGILVAGYAILVILNVLGLGGRKFAFTRYISMAAALLLILQYLIGFGLLGAGYRNNMLHYLIALLAIVTVGAEHMSRGTGNRTFPLIASLLTLVVILAAYYLGMNGAMGKVTS